MLGKLGRLFVALAVLIIGGASLYRMWSERQASNFVAEANAAIEAADKFTDQGREKSATLFTEPNMAAFPGNRNDLEAAAREISGLYAKGAEQYRVAKTKSAEAAKEGIEDKHVLEYWNLKAQEFDKRADARDALRDMTAALYDPSVSSLDELNAKIDSFSNAATARTAEAEQLSSEADKIQKDYPNSFEKK